MNADDLIQKGIEFTKQWFAEQGIKLITSFDRYVEGVKNGTTCKIVVIQRDHQPGKKKNDPYESVMIDHFDYHDKTASFFTDNDRKYAVIARTFREGGLYFAEQAYFVLIPDEVIQAEFAKRTPKTPNSKKTCNIGFQEKQISRWTANGLHFYRMNLDPSSAKVFTNLDGSMSLSNKSDPLEWDQDFDGQTTSQYRKEQTRLRDRLLNGRSKATCSICGETYPEDLLWAAHLKKRSECQPREKGDSHIAALMCKLGCDDLYERGYIGVKEGKVVSLRESTEPALRNKVLFLIGKHCGAWRAETKPYFDWHFSYYVTTERSKE